MTQRDLRGPCVGPLSIALDAVQSHIRRPFPLKTCLFAPIQVDLATLRRSKRKKGQFGANL